MPATTLNPRPAGKTPSGAIPSSARDIAAQVVLELPDASTEAQCRRFDELVGRFAHCQFDANSRCFIVLKRDLKATKTKSKRDDVRTERASERAGREQQLIRNKADEIMSRILYLDFVMPNGARMRDCLGAEMASFGRGFQRIAEKVGAAQKVGDALTEQQVADLLNKAE